MPRFIDKLPSSGKVLVYNTSVHDVLVEMRIDPGYPVLLTDLVPAGYAFLINVERMFGVPLRGE